jgi:hypothetical protein
MSKIPALTAIRLIPRDSDFLDRRIGARGEIFLDRLTNSLRIYDGDSNGGTVIAKADLSNVSNASFLSKATAAGIGSGGGGSTTVSVGDTVPDAPSNGNLWLNTNNGRLYVYINDGDSDQWIQPAVPTTDLTNYATTSFVNSAIAAIPTSEFQIFVSGDDSTVRSIGSGDIIKFLGNGSVTTEVDENGNITITGSVPSSLIGVQDIQFVRGVAVAEFSSDATLSDAANDTVPTESAVKTYVDTALSNLTSVGNFTIASSTIDTDDSSSITVTPSVIFSSDITVENDIFARNNVFATIGVETPTLFNTGILSIKSPSGILLDGLATFNRSAEIVNTKEGATGTVVHDFSTGALFFHSNIEANFTANFTNVPTTNDRSISIALVLDQGATPYIPTSVEINSSLESIKWSGGSEPSGTANYVDIVNFTLIRSGSGWTVLGSLSTYN